MSKQLPLHIRFWAMVNKSETGCWLWTGATANYGYGVIGVGGRANGLIRAHRLSYEMRYGPVPPGLSVCHQCDVPACVNPDHLFLGTHQENVDNMNTKGRGRPPPSRKGEANSSARLTEEMVRAIRRTYAKGGVTTYQLAALYNMSRPAIGYIVNRKTWRHVA